MTSFPESLGPIYPSGRPERRSVGPVQPVRRTDDSIQRQRQMARDPVPVDKAGLGLESLRTRGSDPDSGYGRNAQRAVNAYTDVRRGEDREYVSQVLGVDLYA